MAKKNYNFNVGSKPTLTLENLWANVTVRRGQHGQANIILDGDEKLLEQIEVTQSSPEQVSIKGQVEGDGSITVIQSRGRSVVSVGNIRGGSIVIGGGIHVGGSFIGGNDVTIVNGKVVSGGNKVTVVEGTEPPTITVTMPEGSDLEAYDVTFVDAREIGGRFDASLSGLGQVKVDAAQGMKIRCSGQSQCQVTNAQGDLKTSCSGQSGVSVVGNLGDVEADASGQSHVMVNGNCHDFIAEASGQSNITLAGKASGRVRKHSSGQSHVVAN